LAPSFETLDTPLALKSGEEVSGTLDLEDTCFFSAPSLG
jgi:hypothetical protein